MSKTRGSCDNCGEDVSSLFDRIWWTICSKFRRKKNVLVVRSFPTQMCDLTQWQDNGGKTIARFTPSGEFHIDAR